MSLPLIKLLVPASCPCCANELIDESNGLCPQCLIKIENTYQVAKGRCPLCFVALEPQVEISTDERCQMQNRFCQGRHIFFDKHISLCRFNKDWSKLMRSWKFLGNRYLYQSFLPFIKRKLKELANLEIQRIGYIDSGARKLDLRSFQPCYDIANYVSNMLKIPLAKDLIKIKNKQQSKNELAERFFDIHNSLKLRKDFPSPPPHSYLLVEDVYTSGATANEAGRVLKKAGVTLVYVLSMLKAGDIGDNNKQAK